MSIAFLGSLGEFLAGAQVQILYWSLALAGTILFFALMAMTLMGFGGLHDTEAGPDGMIADHADTGYADFKLISVRSVLAFITFFGWGGVIFGKYGWLGFLAAIGCGFAMMLVTAALVFLVFRLQHSGNVKSDDFIGKSGSVYLGIPGGRIETGKITVAVAGSTHELLAVADEPIPTGATIVVAEKLDDRKFLVRKA